MLSAISRTPVRPPVLLERGLLANKLAAHLQELPENELQFRVTSNPDTGRHVVTLSDAASGQIIMQMPIEAIAFLRQQLEVDENGLFLDVYT